MVRFTEDHEMIRKLVREIVENQIKPNAGMIDETGTFPAENIAKLAEVGITGLNIPEEYGGTGMDEISKVIVISEIARGCASTAEIIAVQLMMNDIILHHGNEEQKKKYLPMAVEGKLGCFALTEPEAGSDVASIKTTAAEKDGGYVINGQKCFISNFGDEEGDYFIVITVTDQEKGSHGGMTAFMVDRDNPGLKLGMTEDKMGLRGASVSEVFLDDCFVEEKDIIGGYGNGIKVALGGLDGGRIGIASQGLGIAQAALEEAIEYSKERVQFGKPISKNQGIRWYIADMATRIEASRQLIYNAAETRMLGGEGLSKLASMAKYFSTETAGYVVDKAVQIHGGYGYMKGYPIERLYRDARITRIYEGTSEVQKIVISKEVYKEYE